MYDYFKLKNPLGLHDLDTNISALEELIYTDILYHDIWGESILHEIFFIPSQTDEMEARIRLRIVCSALDETLAQL